MARLQAFGVGCAKSGTHSLAAMFKDSLRAAHEPAIETLLRMVLRLHANQVPLEVFEARLARLFQELDLDLNVSQVNGFIIGVLMRLYPDARYVLTVRDCRSWLFSCVNYQLTMRPNNPNSAWQAFRNLRFRPRQYPHTPEDAFLKESGLYSIDAYLAYWARHSAKVIAAVPPAQLLIVPMKQLSGKGDEIAAFLGVPPQAVNRGKTHDHAAHYIKTPLDDLDPGWLSERLAHHQQTLIDAVSAHVPQGTLDAVILKGAGS